MKKLWVFIGIIISLSMMPSIGYAANDAFVIDNANVYEGMAKAYKDGYTPTVSGNMATIVLPVVTNAAIVGDRITVTPDLGATSGSPFVYSNYQKDILLSNNPVNYAASTVSSYLIRFDLPLKPNRVNGVFPVKVNIQASDAGGTSLTQSFTAYVTITDGINPDATPAPEPSPIALPPANFKIDNRNVYEGMDKSYTQGYSPTVKNSVATIVMPVICDSYLNWSMITATPNLGSTDRSPFIYRNYQKDVPLAQNPINGGAGSVASYYIRFDLSLSEDRFNGVYPVVVSIQGKTIDGETAKESFTAYVTIADGKDPNATPRPDIPTSEPVVIVSANEISPTPVQAGNEFSARIALKNTSETKSVQNMTVSASCENKSFTLLNDSDTIYIKKLGKGETTEIELKYQTNAETPVGKYDISLAISYDNSEAVKLSSTGSVSVEVAQQLRVELEMPKIPQEVNAGDTVSLSFQVLNLGRCKVFNARCVLEVAGFIPTGSAFVGNMDPGAAKKSDMSVFIGTKDMSDGYEGSDKYGFSQGIVKLIYENENGQEFTDEFEINSTINPPIITTMKTQEPEPDTASQWWITIVIGAALIICLAAILVVWNRRKNRRFDDD